jgi:hypothetical protein
VRIHRSQRNFLKTIMIVMVVMTCMRDLCYTVWALCALSYSRYIYAAAITLMAALTMCTWKAPSSISPSATTMQFSVKRPAV